MKCRMESSCVKLFLDLRWAVKKVWTNRALEGVKEGMSRYKKHIKNGLSHNVKFNISYYSRS